MGEYLNRYIRSAFQSEQEYQDYINQKTRVQWDRPTSDTFQDICDMEEYIDQYGIYGWQKETFMNLFTTYAYEKNHKIDALDRNLRSVAASLREKIKKEPVAQDAKTRQDAESAAGQTYRCSKPDPETHNPASYILKAIGKYLLLLAVHVGTILICATAMSFIFYLLMKTDFGIGFVYHFTGGWPSASIVIIACSISYFLCSEIADRLNADRILFALGITILAFSIAFAIYNLIHSAGILSNIIQAILGIIFIRSYSPKSGNRGY